MADYINYLSIEKKNMPHILSDEKNQRPHILVFSMKLEKTYFQNK
jgi:hypothetical protein